MSSAARVSLVIPTWNGGPLLEEVLTAVDRQPGAQELEKLAVDSGSTDGTPDVLEGHGFTVHQVPQREFNHGATRDLAISRTNGDIILLLTQDATPLDDGWLPALVTAYEDPQVGAAYCRQVPRQDCNPLIKKRILEWAAGRTKRVVQRLDDPAEFEAEFDRMEPMARLQLCAYDNVAGSVRRTAWKQHRFGSRAFGEDVAFGKKLILSGHSIVYEPKSAVIHSHNRTPKEEGKRIYCDHKNLKELFGVHVFPTCRGLRRAINEARAQFTATVEELDLPATEKTALRRWARSYATWSAFCMYLGGNADRLQRGMLSGWLFQAIDQHLTKGI